MPDGFVDGDRAAAILGVARQTLRAYLSQGKISIEHRSMPGASNNGRRMLYAIGDVERVRDGGAPVGRAPLAGQPGSAPSASRIGVYCSAGSRNSRTWVRSSSLFS